MANYLFDDVYNKVEYTGTSDSIFLDVEDTFDSSAEEYNSYYIDGVEVFCFLVSSSYAIAVDKNHDLDYYFNGYDSVNVSYSDLTSENTYGYEWGGYGDDSISTSSNTYPGLSNTNSLIELNLQPETEGWPVLWDKVVEFREMVGSDLWYVPTSYPASSEWYYIMYYPVIFNLNNISSITQNAYWSCVVPTGNTGNYAYVWNIAGSSSAYHIGSYSQSRPRNSHITRTRLCRIIYF